MLSFAPWTCAHPQPTTLLSLEASDGSVTAEMHLPLPELELAFGHNVTGEPENRITQWGPDLRTYLVQHIRPASVSGHPWIVEVTGLELETGKQPQSGQFQEVLVRLRLTPPPGATARNFVLHYDAILHQVVTHKVLISVKSDWSTGRMEPTQIGVIAVDTGSGRVDPLPIQLGEGSAWEGFKGMLTLGMRHIREGIDHLLFLLVLLLPSTLLSNGNAWGGFGGIAYSMKRLVRIVTAFTLGHSITLLAGAVHWLQLPSQTVEVLIAGSILITAIHAVRPVFPGRETAVAAVFGLVHGLAFATVLAGLNLAGGPLALSILGFNLGIELMQLFVLLMTMPWLILLSQTPAHPWVRVTGATLAGIAALGWIANRLSGQSNVIERLMTEVTAFAPAAILVLAAIAIPAHFFAALRQRRSTVMKSMPLQGEL
jgi:hypothetical protein